MTDPPCGCIIDDIGFQIVTNPRQPGESRLAHLLRARPSPRPLASQHDGLGPVASGWSAANVISRDTR